MHSDRRAVQRRLTTETKAAFKTTELMVYIGAVLAVIITAAMVKHTSGHADYFRADKALFYIVLLTLGYLASRGLAKSGSPDRYDAPHSE
jgi:hypothetical protein